VSGLKVARLWFGAEHPDGWANLEAVIERQAEPVRRAPATCRPSKVAPPPPVPKAIVRVEREAPPPREPSAEDLFTF